MSPIFAALATFLLIAALICWLLARRAAQQAGLPFGARIVYADTGAWKQVEKPLFSERYRLTGKPDYLVEESRVLIPVEVKPNRTAPAPRESDVMQLAAYALLVEERFAGKRAPYGLLKHRAAVFRIEMTAQLRAALLARVVEMRADYGAREVSRSHAEPRRCRACGYRAKCGQALES
jgi:CRISPR-associated exonuclease Cas4